MSEFAVKELYEGEIYFSNGIEEGKIKLIPYDSADFNSPQNELKNKAYMLRHLSDFFNTLIYEMDEGLLICKNIRDEKGNMTVEEDVYHHSRDSLEKQVNSILDKIMEVINENS